jgi:Mlc titration factor MtfA (ptsG expression regulator)
MFFLRHRRRKRLEQLPTPGTWPAILERYVPSWEHLPPMERKTLTGRMQVFLAEKNFEGCGGLVLDEAMRVAIAGNACLLLLGDPGDYFPGLGSIVVYPESFSAPIRATDHTGVVTETIEERLGESWQEGSVVLAWDSIREVLRGASGDCNVIIHEFAHQVDAVRGISDGAPLRVMHSRYRDWEDLLAFERRQQRTSRRRRGRPTVLDPYAFTCPAELFAVGTETFFMRPVRFKTSHPELFAELQALYGVDPAAWVVAAEN